MVEAIQEAEPVEQVEAEPEVVDAPADTDAPVEAESEVVDAPADIDAPVEAESEVVDAPADMDAPADIDAPVEADSEATEAAEPESDSPDSPDSTAEDLDAQLADLETMLEAAASDDNEIFDDDEESGQDDETANEVVAEKAPDTQSIPEWVDVGPDEIDLDEELCQTAEGPATESASDDKAEVTNSAEQDGKEDAAGSEAETEAVQQSSLSQQLIARFASIMCHVLIVVDQPFVKLSANAKAIIGVVGIATLIVAVATWVMGCFLPPA